MILRPIRARAELQPFIDSFWWFESDCGVPQTSSGVVVPNGKAKFILPYKNSITASYDNTFHESKENKIHFVGAFDKPTIIGSPEQISGSIIIELKPNAAYRFANLPLQNLTNLIFTFDEIYGQQGAYIQNKIADTENIFLKIELLQAFLVQQLFATNQQQGIVDFVTNTIIQSNGLVEIKQLEKKTGYSKRYIDLLFQRYVGLSPKTLAGITRFQKFYFLWANSGATDFYKHDLYNFYYDQSHFIKEFKNFTGGYSPTKYAEVNNDFGKIFYRR